MDIIGNSAQIEKLRKLIHQVAGSNASVLIMGESGTGKELIAKSIHLASKRRHEAFIPINCGAIPGELLESELFGYEKGAFTGAHHTRQGRFELANKGTMLLDEIGDMPLIMQVKLLRVLQEKKIERIGSIKMIDIDVRVIAATNKDLEELVKNKGFREDLFYRLNVFPIYIPALRERMDDLPLLINYFIEQVIQNGGEGFQLSEEAIDKLYSYHWPGNIRELYNIIERLSLLYPNQLVKSHMLPEIIQNENNTQFFDKEDIVMINRQSSEFNLKDRMDEIEKNYIKQALFDTKGIVSHAAKKLGLRRTTLIEKIKKYNLVVKSEIVKNMSSSL